MHGRGVRLATPLPARRSRVQFFFFFGADSGRIGRNTPSQAVPAPKPTWLSAVRMAAEVFLEPNQASIFSFRFPVSSSVMRSKSKFKCLKFLTSLPRGPSTSMTLAFTLILTPSGMSMVSDDKMVFMVSLSQTLAAPLWEWKTMRWWQPKTLNYMCVYIQGTKKKKKPKPFWASVCFFVAQFCWDGFYLWILGKIKFGIFFKPNFSYLGW